MTHLHEMRRFLVWGLYGLALVGFLLQPRCGGSEDPPAEEAKAVETGSGSDTGTGTGTDATTDGTDDSAGASTDDEEEATTTLTTSTASNVTFKQTAAAFSGDGGTFIGISSDGYLITAGANEGGEAGIGAASSAQVIPPKKITGVTGLSDLIAVSGTSGTRVALNSSGGLFEWGSNSSGMAVTTSQDGTPTPTLVPNIARITAIASNGHTLAITADKTVLSWGDNEDGQLGDGTTTNRATPTVISGLSNIIAVSTGGRYSIALTGDGTIYAWGAETSGGLCLVQNGTKYRTPQLIEGLSNITAIAASQGNQSFFVRSNGQVKACGNNAKGQLGDGTTTNAESPVTVIDANGDPVAGVTAVASGEYHSLLLLSNGTVMAMGQNRYGELGDGTTTQRNRAVPVSTLTNIKVVLAGATYSSAAIDGEGKLWSWGFVHGETQSTPALSSDTNGN
jgi:alpha-tubulin suppressor-like RCC1 family protein